MKLTHDELLARAAGRQFTTRADVLAYLSGDTVECLLCGKAYVNLGTHIGRSHGIRAHDYKRAFNIPRKFALMGCATRKRLSELANSQSRLELARTLGAIYGSRGGGSKTQHHCEYTDARYAPKPRGFTSEKPEDSSVQKRPARKRAAKRQEQLLVAPTEIRSIEHLRARIERLEKAFHFIALTLREFSKE
jgi:hypothetical protein